MKQWLLKINLVLLILLSLATGLYKLAGMEADIRLFANIGFGSAAVFRLGLAQVVAAIFLIKPRLRKAGAIILLFTYMLASVAVFASGMPVFGFVSLLFILMSIVPLIPFKTNAPYEA